MYKNHLGSLYITSLCYTGGNPVQLNYSSDDNDISDDGFADVGQLQIPQHFNDEFLIMNEQTDVLSDNFTATNIYKYVYYILHTFLMLLREEVSYSCKGGEKSLSYGNKLAMYP